MFVCAHVYVLLMDKKVQRGHVLRTRVMAKHLIFNYFGLMKANKKGNFLEYENKPHARLVKITKIEQFPRYHGTT